ncbi:MAG: hypothetical protein H8E30_18845, partial [Alphaproteobacteria bacterium]|nr:hypothetical protein [Alphaproteobacteria bacterium]
MGERGEKPRRTLMSRVLLVLIVLVGLPVVGVVGYHLAIYGIVGFTIWEKLEKQRSAEPAEPAAYYLFEFEAEVEGERFSVKSKVECKRVRRIYAMERKAFGMKLASGKGFYVDAPDLCLTSLRKQRSGHPYWAGLPSKKPIVPLIYMTRPFDKPWETRVFFHPEGPPKGSPVRIISSTVSPLTVAESKSYPIEPAGENDPMAHAWKDGRSYRVNEDRPISGRLVYELNSDVMKDLKIKEVVEDDGVTQTVVEKSNKIFVSIRRRPQSCSLHLLVFV